MQAAPAPAFDDPSETLSLLSIHDAAELEEDASCESGLEEEQHVKSCLEKAREALELVQHGENAQGFTELERLFAVDFEWSSWLLVSDETMGQVVTLLRDLVTLVNRQIEASQGDVSKVGGEALDCIYAAIDVLESAMDARFIRNLGSALERPFDQPTSVAVYEILTSSLHCLNAVFYSPTSKWREEVVPPPPMASSSSSEDGDRRAVAPKSFTLTDDTGAESVIWKSRGYDPLQYLLVILHLLSHTSVQTDVTCFWWDSNTVIEQIWKEENLRALFTVIEPALDKLGASEIQEERALLSSLIDSWIHTVYGIVRSDSITGSEYCRSGSSPLRPGEEDPVSQETEKPAVETLTGVSTYLGRWMDARCLPCDCSFCGVQRASMDCMLARWDKRLAHRLIEIDGVQTIGRVSFWLLSNFRKMEVSGDTTGEDLYRVNVALCVEVVHLCVLSDYDVATLADEHSLRARAVRQAIDSGFFNFLLGYFIPRKLCRLEDRQAESSEDQNRARRMARRACKTAIDFFLVAADGWITDTTYNARSYVTIEPFINKRLAPAALRLVELWEEDKKDMVSEEKLLEGYAPFFLKLCEILRLTARYGHLKDIWSTELLEGSVSTLVDYCSRKVKLQFEGGLPVEKTVLCCMATLCDLCHPSLGAKDHFIGASRAVHDCVPLKKLLRAVRKTGCIRTMSYVTRVDLVTMVSTKNMHRPEQTKMVLCAQCYRPPTLERPLLKCGRCKNVYYCSIECQRQNWKSHEHECVSTREVAEVSTNKRCKVFSGAGVVVCSQCSLPASDDHPLLRCGRCKEVAYCSKNCQVNHWLVHKDNCRTTQPTPAFPVVSASS